MFPENKVFIKKCRPHLYTLELSINLSEESKFSMRIPQTVTYTKNWGKKHNFYKTPHHLKNGFYFNKTNIIETQPDSRSTVK